MFIGLRKSLKRREEVETLVVVGGPTHEHEEEEEEEQEEQEMGMQGGRRS